MLEGKSSKEDTWGWKPKVGVDDRSLGHHELRPAVGPMLNQ